MSTRNFNDVLICAPLSSSLYINENKANRYIDFDVFGTPHNSSAGRFLSGGFRGNGATNYLTYRTPKVISDFNLSFFFRVNEAIYPQGLFAITAPPYASISLNSSGNLDIAIGTLETSVASIVLDQWYFIEITCSNGVRKAFLDGVEVFSSTGNQSIAANALVSLGREPAYHGRNNNYCDISEFIFTTSPVGQTSNYSAPTESAFGNVNGLVLDANGTIVEGIKIALIDDGNNFMFSASSDPIGNYSFSDVPSIEMARVAFADDAILSNTYNNVIDRVIPS